MKKTMIRFCFILTICFSILSLECFGIFEKKLIGKINLTGDADYLLQLHIEDEEYIYSIVDIKNQNSELSSFKLIFNDQTTFDLNFKKAINSINNFDEDFKKKAIEESQKYFYALNVIRPALPSEENGPLAMTLKFGNEATIRKVSYGKTQYVKKKELFNFISENKIVKGKIEKIDTLPWKNPERYLKRISPEEAKTEFINSISKKFPADTIKLIEKTIDGIDLNEQMKNLYSGYYDDAIRNLRKLKSTRYTKPNKIKESLGVFQDYVLNTKHLAHEVLAYQILSNKDSIASLEKKDELNKKNINENQIKIQELKEKIKIADLKIDSINNEISKIYENIISEISDFNIEIIERDNYEDESKLKSLTSNLKQQLDLVYLRIPESLKTHLSSKIEISESFRTVNQSSNDDDFFYRRLFSNQITSILEDISFLNKITDKVIPLQDNLKIDSLELKKTESNLVSLEEKSFKYSDETYKLKLFNKKIEEFYTIQLFNSGIYNVKISSIQFEFNNGFIENMLVMTEPSSPFSNNEQNQLITKELPKKIKFSNQYPLGFSAKRDINVIKYATLIAIVDDKTEFSLNFRDVVSNVEELLVLDRTDYSPLNSSIKLNPKDTPEKDLYKDKSTEILQAKIFSDLSGINGEKPNGLIQFEVDKEIPLITKRYGKSDIRAPFRWLIPRKNNVGFFNFIKPEFVLSKIESNLKDLKLTRTNTETLYASTLDIRQFEKVSVGADLNLTFMDMPFAKSTLYTNAGFRFGRTDLSVDDTLQNNSKGFTNTFQFNPEFGYKINGDERYGLDFNYSPNFIISDERGFKQIGDTYLLKNDQQINEQNKLHRITLTAYFNFNPGTKGRFFFRFRSFHQWDKWSNNFSQYQLGYSTFITR